MWSRLLVPVPQIGRTSRLRNVPCLDLEVVSQGKQRARFLGHVLQNAQAPEDEPGQPGRVEVKVPFHELADHLGRDVRKTSAEPCADSEGTKRGAAQDLLTRTWEHERAVVPVRLLVLGRERLEGEVHDGGQRRDLIRERHDELSQKQVREVGE